MIVENGSYVRKAEEVISDLQRKTDKKGNPIWITTSQIRNLLAMSADIYNEARLCTEEKLPQDILNRVSYLKIRCVYEAGRDAKVRDFIKKAQIIEALDEIGGSRSRYMLFNQYMEALVAYHRFYGGKD